MRSPRAPESRPTAACQPAKFAALQAGSRKRAQPVALGGGCVWSDPSVGRARARLLPVETQPGLDTRPGAHDQSIFFLSRAQNVSARASCTAQKIAVPGSDTDAIARSGALPRAARSSRREQSTIFGVAECAAGAHLHGAR